jgi:hypothetical protein
MKAISAAAAPVTRPPSADSESTCPLLRSRRRWVDPSDPVEGPALAAGYYDLLEALEAAGGNSGPGDGGGASAPRVLPLDRFVAAVRAQVIGTTRFTRPDRRVPPSHPCACVCAWPRLRARACVPVCPRLRFQSALACLCGEWLCGHVPHTRARAQSHFCIRECALACANGFTTAEQVGGGGKGGESSDERCRLEGSEVSGFKAAMCGFEAAKWVGLGLHRCFSATRSQVRPACTRAARGVTRARLHARTSLHSPVLSAPSAPSHGPMCVCS